MNKVPVVDPEVCIGCGTCVALAPQTFQFSEDGKVKVVNPEGDDEETIKEATQACPVNAITLTTKE